VATSGFDEYRDSGAGGRRRCLPGDLAEQRPRPDGDGSGISRLAETRSAGALPRRAGSRSSSTQGCYEGRVVGS
jgi:hypothetical protein